MSTPEEIDAGARRMTAMVALLFAGAMHLVVGGFVALSGRLAPSWAVATLTIGWLGLAALIWRWHGRRPLATLVLPFAGALALWGILRLGGQLLDWGSA